MSTLLAIVGSFLLYALLLPLFGVAIGFIARVIVPYAIGVAAVYLLTDALFGWSGSQWLFAVMSLSWVVAVWHSRFCLKKLRGHLAWYEGHYFGVLNTLTFSRSLQLRRTAWRCGGGE